MKARVYRSESGKVLRAAGCEFAVVRKEHVKGRQFLEKKIVNTDEKAKVVPMATIWVSIPYLEMHRT